MRAIYNYSTACCCCTIGPPMGHHAPLTATLGSSVCTTNCPLGVHASESRIKNSSWGTDKLLTTQHRSHACTCDDGAAQQAVDVSTQWTAVGHAPHSLHAGQQTLTVASLGRGLHLKPSSLHMMRPMMFRKASISGTRGRIKWPTNSPRSGSISCAQC